LIAELYLLSGLVNMHDLESLARAYTRTAVKTLAGIMMEQTSPPMARIAAAKVLLDRGWGKCSETHKINLDGETSLLKVVNGRCVRGFLAFSARDVCRR
jgi:hypothetical protein